MPRLEEWENKLKDLELEFEKQDLTRKKLELEKLKNEITLELKTVKQEYKLYQEIIYFLEDSEASEKKELNILNKIWDRKYIQAVEIGISEKKKRKYGVFYTPRPISVQMAQMLEINEGEIGNIIDPCIGSGNLLWGLIEVYGEKIKKRFFGMDILEENINYCKKTWPEIAHHFIQGDVLKDDWNNRNFWIKNDPEFEEKEKVLSMREYNDIPVNERIENLQKRIDEITHLKTNLSHFKKRIEKMDKLLKINQTGGKDEQGQNT